MRRLVVSIFGLVYVFTFIAFLSGAQPAYATNGTFTITKFKHDTSIVRELDFTASNWSPSMSISDCWIQIYNETASTYTTEYVGNRGGTSCSSSEVWANDNDPSLADATYHITLCEVVNGNITSNCWTSQSFPVVDGWYQLQDYSLHSWINNPADDNDLTNNGATGSTDTPISVSTQSANLVASSNACLQGPNSSSLRPTGNFTVESWVKFTSMPGGGNYPKLFQSYSQNSGIAGIALGVSGDSNKAFLTVGKATGTSQGTDFQQVIGSTVLTTGTWYHIAGVYNGSTIELFVNGVSDGSVSWSGNPGYATSNYVRIGCANTTGTDLYFLNGNVDEVRVWNVARTQQQLSTNYQNELTGTESGLVAYYPFDTLNPSAFTYNDKTSNGNDLTNYYATELTTSLPFSASKEAVSLNGSNACLQAPNASALRPTGNFTVESWVKFTSMPGSGNYPKFFQSYSQNSGIAGIAFGISGDSNKAFLAVGKATGTSQGTDFQQLFGNTVLTTGTWYHLAAVYDGSTMEIFLNGVSDGSVSWSGNPGYATDNYVRIGCTNTTGTDLYFLNGNVDDVRVWNVARTQSQISTNYQSQLVGNESGLVGYYPFEL